MNRLCLPTSDGFSQHRRGAAKAALLTLSALLLQVATASASFAQDTAAPAAAAPKIDTGDTAWLLVSSALVLLMTPGLALFYGGMVRTKNILNVLMQSFIAISLVTVLWTVGGYSLAFSKGTPFVGGLAWMGLSGVGQEPNAFYGATVPHQVFMVFQMMFAIITPALISGAIAERMKFSAYVVFIGLWSLLCYVPLAHMVWGEGGFLRDLGALDFAGGTVVHISSGISALVLAILLGKRRLDRGEDTRPHNVPHDVNRHRLTLVWLVWLQCRFRDCFPMVLPGPPFWSRTLRQRRRAWSGY